MADLIPLQCPNCAGHVDRTTLACKSCGLQFKMKSDGSLMRVDVYEHKFIPIGTAIAMPGYYVKSNPQEAMEMTLHEMAEKLAVKILPLIEFQTEYDIRHNEYVTYGRIRVEEPKFDNGRFEEVRRLSEGIL